MFKKDPEGYRKLLAYQKAMTLQQATNELVRFLPKTKTFLDLADQMARSGRSGSKNIVEGWKRNTTQEYFTFLGFCIGAVSELMEDAADVITGVYPELMGIREIMGAKGGMGLKGTLSSPYSPSSHHPLPTPSRSLMTREELDQLKFYPPDATLPPIVQLFLQAKEVNYLLYKLQQSLDVKMDTELTKPVSNRVRENWDKDKTADAWLDQYLKNSGSIRLENGQFVSKNK